MHALDGLRGFAALIVLLHHLVISNAGIIMTKQGHDVIGRLLSSIGASGVELFFCLSAVVLMRPHLRAGRPFKGGEYVKRRAARLLPPFLAAWMLAGAVVALVWAAPTWWTTSSDVPQFDTMTWLSQIALGFPGRWEYNAAWWSLTVELMFYMLVPGVLLSLSRAGEKDRVVSGALWIALLASFAVFPVEVSHPQWTIVIRLAYYSSCFAAGIYLARRDLAPKWRNISVLGGVVIVAAGVASPLVNLHVGYGLIYFGAVAWAMDRQSVFAKALSGLPFIWLGERSYSLFLTHYSAIFLSCWMVSMVTTGKGVVYFAASRVLSIILSLILACFVFQLIERRFAHGLITADMWLPPVTLQAPEHSKSLRRQA